MILAVCGGVVHNACPEGRGRMVGVVTTAALKPTRFSRGSMSIPNSDSSELTLFNHTRQG